MTERSWYLVQCKAGQTGRADENLRNQNYECFLPMLEVERIKGGRRKRVTEPLFPGYVFVHLDKIEDNWGPIRSTRGVSRIVSFNGMPLPINDEIIEELESRSRMSDALPAIQKGDRIRITSGPFKELEAIFDSFDGEQRVVILLELLHTQQRLHLPIESVLKI